MTLLKKVALAGLLATMLSGCATSSVIPVGTATFAPLPAFSEVTIFMDEMQVEKNTHAHTVVGIVNYSNPGKYQSLSLSDAIPDLREKARKVGANGIIIDQQNVIYSGFISRGISVSGRAIVYEK